MLDKSRLHFRWIEEFVKTVSSYSVSIFSMCRSSFLLLVKSLWHTSLLPVAKGRVVAMERLAKFWRSVQRILLSVKPTCSSAGSSSVVVFTRLKPTPTITYLNNWADGSVILAFKAKCQSSPCILLIFGRTHVFIIPLHFSLVSTCSVAFRLNNYCTFNERMRK